jgi:hypothetical protein
MLVVPKGTTLVHALRDIRARDTKAAAQDSVCAQGILTVYV